jgi:hypothetical protein
MELKALLQRCDLFYKTARKAEDLAVLKSNVGNYIHFSDSDRLGIHYSKDVHPGNPKAIYGFPLTPQKCAMIERDEGEAFENYGYRKYIYIFSVTGNILNMDNPNLTELSAKIKDFVRANYPKASYHTLYVPTPGPYTSSGAEFLSWLNRIAGDSFKDKAVGVNVLLRGIGYDAMETNNYGFGDDIAREIAVLNPSSVVLIAKLNNPMRTKEIDSEMKQLELRRIENAKSWAEKEKKMTQNIAKRNEYSQEAEKIRQMESKLWREHKFDEADLLRRDFKQKWDPILQSLS